MKQYLNCLKIQQSGFMYSKTLHHISDKLLASLYLFASKVTAEVDLKFDAV